MLQQVAVDGGLQVIDAGDPTHSNTDFRVFSDTSNGRDSFLRRHRCERCLAGELFPAPDFHIRCTGNCFDIGFLGLPCLDFIVREINRDQI